MTNDIKHCKVCSKLDYLYEDKCRKCLEDEDEKEARLQYLGLSYNYWLPGIFK